MNLNSFSTGLAGLILGAVLGVVCSALLEDALKDRFRLVGTLIRHSLARGTLPTPRTEFHLGNLQTSMLILEGDGVTPINEESVRVLVDDEKAALPDEVEGWREEIARTQAERKENGEQHFWNGPSYAVVGLAVSREGISETPEICLRLQSSDYYTFQATQQLDRPMMDGTTLRTRYLSNGPEAAPAFMNCSFGTNVAMVTKDHKLVIAKRSLALGSRPGVWNSSANEALSRSLDSDGRTPPNIYNVARRGVDEELAIGREEYRLELLAITIDTELQQWGAAFVAYAHDLTGQDILDRRTRGAPDKWENERIEIIDFTVDEVVRCLMSPERRDNWSPMGPPLYYLALVNFYGRGFTERRSARALRIYDRSPGSKRQASALMTYRSVRAPLRKASKGIIQTYQVAGKILSNAAALFTGSGRPDNDE
jgi:hypothetical protein